MMTTWAPKVCKIMAFMAIIMGLGLVFYILLGFRYMFCDETLNLHLQALYPHYSPDLRTNTYHNPRGP